MPIFEFVCDKCHQEFEELVFDDTAPVCPACGASQTRKLMSCPCVCRSGGAEEHGVSAPSGGGKCAGCAGGHCSTCH